MRVEEKIYFFSCCCLNWTAFSFNPPDLDFHFWTASTRLKLYRLFEFSEDGKRYQALYIIRWHDLISLAIPPSLYSCVFLSGVVLRDRFYHFFFFFYLFYLSLFWMPFKRKNSSRPLSLQIYLHLTTPTSGWLVENASQGSRWYYKKGRQSSGSIFEIQFLFLFFLLRAARACWTRRCCPLSLSLARSLLPVDLHRLLRGATWREQEIYIFRPSFPK